MSAKPEKILRIHGSNTLGAKLGPALVKAWLVGLGFDKVKQRRIRHEEVLISAVTGEGKPVEVEVFSHGSSTGFISLFSGKADVAMSSRVIKFSETTKLEKLGDMRDRSVEKVVGLDGIAIVVNKANSIKSLDRSDLSKIFSGEIKDWSELGGHASPIHLYSRDKNSGTYEIFKSRVLSEKHQLPRDVKSFNSNVELSNNVSTDSAGIGFVSLSDVGKTKVLSISDHNNNPILPNQLTVATEDYVFSRRLYLYAPVTKNVVARDFVAFCVSKKGQQIVSKQGFVSLNIQPYKNITHHKVPKEYVKLTSKAKRLSLNIRFKEGRYLLDNKAVNDLQRLSKYMAESEHKGAKLILFGFSDNAESVPVYSIELSTTRADAVADRLLSQGIEVSHVRGYGSDMPVATNETQYGRHKNRRVEIWIE